MDCKEITLFYRFALFGLFMVLRKKSKLSLSHVNKINSRKFSQLKICQHKIPSKGSQNFVT